MVNSPLSEQDVNWSNVNKYTNKKIKKKHLPTRQRRAVLQGCWSKLYCLKKYLLQVLAIGKWSVSVAKGSNAFPGKYFAPYKLQVIYRKL